MDSINGERKRQITSFGSLKLEMMKLAVLVHLQRLLLMVVTVVSHGYNSSNELGLDNFAHLSNLSECEDDGLVSS